MSIPEFSFATLNSARISTAPEIRVCINLPKSEKQFSEILGFKNLAELVLDVSAGFGEIPECIKDAKNLRLIRIENLDKYREEVVLPEIFLELPQLETLHILYSKNLKWGNKNWSAMTNLKRFYVYCSADVFPMGLVKAPALENIDLSSSYYPEFPVEVAQIKTLKSLYINGRTLQNQTIPKEITTLPLLEKVDLWVDEIPEWIGDFNPNLKDLSVYPNKKQSTITEKIFEYRELQRLSLYHVGIEQLSPKIGQLTKLTYLNLAGNLLTNLPDEFARLANLEQLYISQNDFKKMPGVIAKLTKLTRFEYKHQGMHTSDLSRFEKFLKWVHPSIWPNQDELRNFLADMWDGKDIPNDKIDCKMLEKALFFGISPIDTNAFYYLQYKSPQAYRPFKSGDVLYLNGKFNMKITELRNKLKPLGIAVVNAGELAEPDSKVTHVLVDETAKVIPLYWLGNTRFCLMSATQLMEFLNNQNPDYLVEEVKSSSDSQAADQVNALLFSLDNANIEVGLGLLKSGGVPEECKTALFTAYKLADDPKTRSAAGKLLQQAASEKLREAMQKRVNFYSAGWLSYIAIANYLAAFDGTEIDMPRFALAYYKKKGKCDILFYLMERKAADCLREFFRLNVDENKTLKLSMSYYRENITGFPLELFDIQDIKHLHIYAYIDNLTLEGAFPQDFLKLTNLESLDVYLGTKPPKEMPPVLAKMTWLKELKINSGEEVKEQLRSALPNCNVL